MNNGCCCRITESGACCHSLRRKSVLRSNKQTTVGVCVCVCVWTGATWLPLAATDDDEFCQHETFTARCDGRQDVVLMESAGYGRLRLGRCARRDLGYLGCMVDALRLLDSRCSGQPHGCSVSVMDTQLRQLRPCPLDVTWHLHARYRCVKGAYSMQGVTGVPTEEG